MDDYYEELRQQPEFPCENCRWVDIVYGHEAPCKYCDKCGCEDEPEDFNYQKLKEEKLFETKRKN